jgi:hypothetical protein
MTYWSKILNSVPNFPGMKFFTAIFLLLGFILSARHSVNGQVFKVSNNKSAGQLIFGNQKIKLTLDYKNTARIASLVLNGQEILDSAGIYTNIKTSTGNYNSKQLLGKPFISITSKNLVLRNIVYGDENVRITETWTFEWKGNAIDFGIERTISKPILVEQVSLPLIQFKSIDTWEGAYQSYGGLAWFYLFSKPLDTYGVHSSSTDFWNSNTGNGLSVTVTAPAQQVAMQYTRTADNKLAYQIGVSPGSFIPKFDSGTHRRLYLTDRTDVWAPFMLKAGTSSQHIGLSYFNVEERYGRGKFAGIDGKQVSAVLNTIARIGVIDKEHFGGNSWHTPYGPICLHEQYIAQLGLGINDDKYLKGYEQCLNFYHNNAIKPDGRVWPRWAYSNEDMMPGEVTEKGFYEAQWGYLLDANPDLVTNTVELYNQTGNKTWVRSHKQTCEKVLDWLLKRDSNKNGLVEMMTDSQQQKRGSDWIDIIWASFENAFVNAKLYHALVLWSDMENQLGDATKSNYYKQFAQQLKTSFNKPVSEGGFWDTEKQCYIYWRAKDGSPHGNNLVTPVNFMAIGYGICDDSARIKAVLDNIETQMQKEQLFFWPLCMTSFQPGEGNDWQFPFPNYENGDIFLSWGALGVKVYADYKPEIALKYVQNVLGQYTKDGLAFQRYGRAKQDGLGDDILSGNSLSVVGLYQAIYGINPMYNRFYLNPHITPALAGTELTYKFRKQALKIGLDVNKYTVTNGRFSISSSSDFGFNCINNTLYFYKGSNSSPSIVATANANAKIAIQVNAVSSTTVDWNQQAGAAASAVQYTVYGLKPVTHYLISINDKKTVDAVTDSHGQLIFKPAATKNSVHINIIRS